jgi:cytidyltransferase-like protein
MKKKIVLVTGGFDPLHSGHIAYFEAAKQLGDELWVGLNSDSWLANKKGRHFMPITERASIVKIYTWLIVLLQTLTTAMVVQVEQYTKHLH